MRIRKTLTAAALAMVTAVPVATVAVSSPALATTHQYNIRTWLAPSLAWHNNGPATWESLSTNWSTETVTELPGGGVTIKTSSNNCFKETSGQYLFEEDNGCAGTANNEIWNILAEGGGRYVIQNYEYGDYIGVWDPPNGGETIRTKPQQSGFDIGWSLFGFNAKGAHLKVRPQSLRHLLPDG